MEGLNLSCCEVHALDEGMWGPSINVYEERGRDALEIWESK